MSSIQSDGRDIINTFILFYSVLDESSTLELLSVSIVCNNGDENYGKDLIFT